MNIGETYRRHSSWQKNRWSELIDLLKQIKLEQNTLLTGIDLGCGSGSRTFDFLKKFPSIKKIHAIDANPSMITCAKAKFSGKEIKYYIKKIEDLSAINSKKLDFILGNYSIHWVQNKAKVFKALNKKSKKGTLLLIGTVEKLPNMLKTIDSFLRNEWKIKKKSPHYYLNQKQWLNLLNKFGWEIVIERKNTDIHVVKAGKSFLKEWYAASTGAAFYHKDINELKTPIIQRLQSMLSLKYGVKKNTEWLYKEKTYLFIARKK